MTARDGIEGTTQAGKPSERLTDLLGQLAFDLSVIVINLGLRIPSHRFRRAFARRVAAVDLGTDVSLARSVRLTVRGGVDIGDRSIVNSDVLLDGRGGLSIGRDVNISPGVIIWSAEHDPQSADFAGRTNRVSIGDRAWIASGAVLLPGVRVGEGSVVGAGAVARGELAEWTIFAGNPARPVGERSRDAQAALRPYRRFFG